MEGPCRCGREHGSGTSTSRVTRRLAPARAPKNGQIVDPSELYHRAKPLEGTQGAQYLAGRGLNAELAAAAGVKFSPGFAGAPAIVYPLRNPLTGELVGVEGRYIDREHQPKTRAFGPKGEGAFIMPGALDGDQLVLVEGLADTLALASAGIRALCTAGARVPDWLPELVQKRAVIAAFDADEAGDQQAAAIMQSLAPDIPAARWRPPAGRKDWAELLQLDGAEALGLALVAMLTPAPALDRFLTQLDALPDRDAKHELIRRKIPELIGYDAAQLDRWRAKLTNGHGAGFRAAAFDSILTETRRNARHRPTVRTLEGAKLPPGGGRPSANGEADGPLPIPGGHGMRVDADFRQLFDRFGNPEPSVFPRVVAWGRVRDRDRWETALSYDIVPSNVGPDAEPMTFTRQQVRTGERWGEIGLTGCDGAGNVALYSNLVLMQATPDRRHDRHTRTGWDSLAPGAPLRFIVSSGIVDAEGLRPALTDLPQPLDRYTLQATEGATLHDAAEALERFLDGWPYRITIPLLADMMKAPLIRLVRPWSQTNTLQTGPKGSGKTSSLVCALNVWGPLAEADLPTFNASPQGHEEAMAAGRDVPFPLDNARPGTVAEEHEQERLLKGALYSFYAHKGRQRAQRDGSAASTRDPLGLLSATGEGIPSGLPDSAKDRILVLKHYDRDTSMARIAAAHSAMGALPLLTIAYLSRLCRQGDALRSTLGRRRSELLDAESDGRLSRDPYKIADRQLALEELTATLVEAGLWGAEQRATFLAESLGLLREAAEAQREDDEELAPTERLRRALIADVQMKRVLFEAPDYGSPENAPEEGWTLREVSYRDAEGVWKTRLEPARASAVPLGYIAANERAGALEHHIPSESFDQWARAALAREGIPALGEPVASLAAWAGQGLIAAEGKHLRPKRRRSAEGPRLRCVVLLPGFFVPEEVGPVGPKPVADSDLPHLRPHLAPAGGALVGPEDGMVGPQIESEIGPDGLYAPQAPPNREQKEELACNENAHGSVTVKPGHAQCGAEGIEELGPCTWPGCHCLASCFDVATATEPRCRPHMENEPPNNTDGPVAPTAGPTEVSTPSGERSDLPATTPNLEYGRPDHLRAWQALCTAGRAQLWTWPGHLCPDCRCFDHLYACLKAGDCATADELRSSVCVHCCPPPEPLSPSGGLQPDDELPGPDAGKRSDDPEPALGGDEAGQQGRAEQPQPDSGPDDDLPDGELPPELPLDEGPEPSPVPDYLAAWRALAAIRVAQVWSRPRACEVCHHEDHRFGFVIVRGLDTSSCVHCVAPPELPSEDAPPGDESPVDDDGPPGNKPPREPEPPPADESEARPRHPNRLATLGADGLYLMAQGYPQRLDAPVLANVGELLDFMVRVGVRQLWVHRDGLSSLGLPPELPRDEHGRPREDVPHRFLLEHGDWDIGEPTLRWWYRAKRGDLSLQVAVAPYSAGSSWAECWAAPATATELLTALSDFSRALDNMLPVGGAARTGIALWRRQLGRMQAGKDLRPLTLPSAALSGKRESDLAWIPPLPPEKRLPGLYVHSWDANGRYAGSMAGLRIGIGDPTHLVGDALHFNRTQPGLWLSTIETADLPGNLPDPLGCDSHPRWRTSPSLELAQQLGIPVRLHEAYIWERSSRLLERFYETARDGRRSLHGSSRDALKRLYVAFVGMLGSRTWNQDDVTFQPVVRESIIAESRTRLWRTLRRCAEEGQPPSLVYVDEAAFVSENPDALGAKPEAIRLDESLGGFKHSASKPLAELLPAWESGRIVTVLDALKGGEGVE
jgi:hypothetical protein